MSLPKISAHFTEKALRLFKSQYEHNEVYRDFCMHISRTPASVKELADIPFLPIEFFKTHDITSFNGIPELEFHSSGTTKGPALKSRHFVDLKERYEDSILNGFREFREGEHKKLRLFALLPGYLDNKNSSLLYMIDFLSRSGLVEFMGYYIDDFQKLKRDIEWSVGQAECQILLWGVSFALLDFAAAFPCDLRGHIVLETGGMKGRRKEMLRTELHATLSSAFNVTEIYSEYGMTELLSQAYSKGHGLFRASENMEVLIRDVYDPLQLMPVGESGAINVIDLNNAHSCSFIATQDLGRRNVDGTFEIMGRMDHSDVRGCNLLSI